MALEVKISVSLSVDKKSFAIVDNGTDWTPLPKPSVTAIIANVYGESKTSPLKQVTLDASERDDFLNGSGTTLTFLDDRLFGTDYAPDNYYTITLTVNTLYTSDSDGFAIQLALAEAVHINNASVNLPAVNLFKSLTATQAALALDTIERVANTEDTTREQKWRDIYYFIQGNIINKY